MRRTMLVTFAVVAVSCGTSSSVESAPDAAGADVDAGDGGRVCADDVATALPACAAFDPDASPPGARSRATRTVLLCAWSDGVNGVCGADGTTTVCTGPIDAGTVTCRRGCCPDEYAFSHGDETPVPAGCRAVLGPAPGGGGVVYCCPC